jgi:DNA polymerase III alpha subunit
VIPESNSFCFEEIESITEVGEEECYDISLQESDVFLGEPNYIANDFVVHNSGMHESYIRRKKGLEEYARHPLLDPLIGMTNYVLVYQEQIAQVLNKVGLIPEAEAQPIIKAISKKNKAKFEPYKGRFIDNAQKTLGCSLEYAGKLWEQIEASAAYSFNKSHSVAYSYVTMMQLWLKVYYPVEYITAVMSCLKTADDRMMEYKLDALKHGVKIKPADINLSRENFTIRDDDIYWGLGKIKGIGEEVAQRIVAGQPYRDLQDFLARFGTDGTVLKPLIAVRVFKESSAVDLWRTYAKYKKYERQRGERTKRFGVSQKKLLDQVREILPGVDPEALSGDELLYKAHELGVVDQFRPVWKKVEVARDRFRLKMATPMDIVGEDEGGVPEDLGPLLRDEAKGEAAFYGFVWTHPLQKCGDFDPAYTFDAHRVAVAKGGKTYRVDVQIVEVKERTSKKGTTYHQLVVEDVGFERNVVNVWADDFKRFARELVQGGLVRLALDPPSGGFKTYALQSYPPWKRHSVPPKEQDIRVVVLRPGPVS